MRPLGLQLDKERWTQVGSSGTSLAFLLLTQEQPWSWACGCFRERGEGYCYLVPLREKPKFITSISGFHSKSLSRETMSIHFMKEKKKKEMACLTPHEILRIFTATNSNSCCANYCTSVPLALLRVGHILIHFIFPPGRNP